MSPTRARLATCALACGAALAASRPAAAEPSSTERALAETLFRDAKKLLQRGKTPEACAKLSESYRIDPAGGTLINLAMCHEIEGKTASAWTEFGEALAAAKKASRADREKAAREHLAAIEPRLSRVTVTSNAGANAEVRLDGVVVASTALGTAVPLDPGEHTVRATAPGMAAWEEKFVLKEGETRAVLVTALTPETAAPPPPPPPDTPWKRPTGIAALAAGAVLLGVGAGFGARAISVGARANTECPAHMCSPAGLSDVSSAKSAATISNATLVAGGVLAAAGVTLIVLSARTPSDSGAAAWMTIAPAVGRATAGLSIEGAL